jgi:hypothetical protein
MGFQGQDVLLILYAILLNTTVFRGITRPAHLQTHVLIIVGAICVPFISFDFEKLGDVPGEAWAFCGSFVVVQTLHTLFHYLYPKAIHANGPEILFQPIVCIWGAMLRVSIRPDVWYRGELGVLYFATSTIFISLAVLMVIYMAELTSSPDDEIDFYKDSIYTKSNSAFIGAIPASLFVTLFITFYREPLSPLLLLAATVSFIALRVVVPPKDVPNQSAAANVAAPASSSAVSANVAA